MHAAFTVDATWLVPIDAPGGLVLLDVDTTVPLTIERSVSARSEADVAGRTGRAVQLLGTGRPCDT